MLGWRKGEGGPLEGLPLGIKDLFCTEGVRTTACSHILDNFVPTYESTVTANLWRDGAVLLGKLNNDEFAMGSSNETSCFGPVASPWRRRGSDAKLVPGGSSGGSAAAVAAKLCVGATGTDTGGSIRQPAAFCGIVGLKPTYGRCSRWGIVAFASSLDQAGPFARSVRDCAILLRSMAGHDPKDTTSADIGRCRTMRHSSALRSKACASAFRRNTGCRACRLKSRRSGSAARNGSEMPARRPSTSPCRTPNTRCRHTTSSRRPRPLPISRAMTAYATACAFPAATSSICTSSTRADGFGKEVRRRIMIGTYVLSAGYYDAYYLRAQKVRTLIKRDFETCFADGIDAILTPTTPSAAFAIGEKGRADPVEMYLNDIFTVTVNMAGLPGISVPSGLDAQGLPLGLQLVGRPFEEETLFALGAVIEQAAGFFRPERWW